MSDAGEELARILSRGKPQRRQRWLMVFTVLLVFIAAGWLWMATSARESKVSFITDPVEQGDLTVTVTATGTVEPTTQINVSSELSGTIAQVGVTYNDAVKVGTILARLDDTKLKAQVVNSEAAVTAAAARVSAAEATLREAKENLATAQELDRRGVTSRSALTSAQATHDRSAADLDIARADLILAKANLDLVRADLAKSVIQSPINGVVLSRTAEPGQIVAASLSAPVLFTLAEDLSKMQLLVDIDEADIGKVQEGNSAVFIVDAYDDVEFPARIVQVRYAPETAENVVTYKAVLVVDNPDGLLRPGMTATATITVSVAQDTLTVSNSALRYAPPAAQGARRGGSGLLGLIMPRRSRAASVTGSGDAIWVMRDGQPVEIAVKRAETDGKRTVVSAPGLAAGDLAITAQTTAGN